MRPDIFQDRMAARPRDPRATPRDLKAPEGYIMHFRVPVSRIVPANGEAAASSLADAHFTGPGVIYPGRRSIIGVVLRHSVEGEAVGGLVRAQHVHRAHDFFGGIGARLA